MLWCREIEIDRILACWQEEKEEEEEEEEGEEEGEEEEEDNHGYQRRRHAPNSRLVLWISAVTSMVANRTVSIQDPLWIQTLWHSARPAKVRVTMGLEENLEGDVSWIRKSLECFYDTLLRCSVVLDDREIDFEILA
ncbi:hypothetical protein V1477_010737 [Vespula maculifrons]|uniref:Uncharacterized protein n=1 Tax=Vespula maculifrons TaxID=7453 RepID=A0ABD2C2U3_VESMC